ncbi:PREDICTED: UPF0688 protein C1orf174 homolog [Gekko japonicus]|uniref:UPF0688 protein C1orf174 homolog n=1 Tax=Gekko japonicus TaxID=146911 RepID=A0ABM1K8Z2_GEKJA|nr:PREDICTED: UPF0688 protein C1orf174 homolog [Gekko japonicus]
MRARRGPSRKATDRRPPKKLKCEKRNRAKLKIPEVDVCASSSGGGGIFSKEPANKISGANECSPSPPVLRMMLQSEGEGIPEISAESLVDQAELGAESSVPGANDCSPKAANEPLFLPGIQNEEGEEENCGTGSSDDSEMEPEEAQDCFLELDNSAFLNEDSNQPLPVDRFFGSVAFMQSPPPPRPPNTIASPTNRREFRKLHFIAKDDEEEDEDDDVV